MNISMTPQEHREAEAFCEEIKHTLSSMLVRGDIRTRIIQVGGLCLIEIVFSHIGPCYSRVCIHPREYGMQSKSGREGWYRFTLELLIKDWSEAHFLKEAV